MGDKRKQVGDKYKIMRAEHPERTSGRKTSPETNAKSCGRRTHPFRRSKNPSQVNLFGDFVFFIWSFVEAPLPQHRVACLKGSTARNLPDELLPFCNSKFVILKNASVLCCFVHVAPWLPCLTFSQFWQHMRHHHHLTLSSFVAFLLPRFRGVWI